MLQTTDRRQTDRRTGDSILRSLKIGKQLVTTEIAVSVVHLFRAFSHNTVTLQTDT